MNIDFTTLLACFWNVDQDVINPTFHNVLGMLWERFVCHFEKYLYLFMQS